MKRQRSLSLPSRTALPASCTQASHSSRLGLSKGQVLLHFHPQCWFVKAQHSSALCFLLVSQGKCHVESLWTETPNMPRLWSAPEDLPCTQGFCFRHYWGNGEKERAINADVLAGLQITAASKFWRDQGSDGFILCLDLIKTCSAQWSREP